VKYFRNISWNISGQKIMKFYITTNNTTAASNLAAVMFDFILVNALTELMLSAIQL